MDSLRWRIWAKVVAIVDFVPLLIGYGYLAIWALDFYFSTQALAVFIEDSSNGNFSNSSFQSDFSDDDETSTYPSFSGTAVLIVLGISLPAAILTIQMWAAVKLFNATSLGSKPHESFGKARIWIIITVIFLILGIFGGVFNLFKVATVELPVNILLICAFSVIFLGIRGLEIYVVKKFMKELDILRSRNVDDMCNVSMKV